MSRIEIECVCGRLLSVESLDTYLTDEDHKSTEVTCACRERYRVEIGLTILGKEKSPAIDFDRLGGAPC